MLKQRNALLNKIGINKQFDCYYETKSKNIRIPPENKLPKYISNSSLKYTHNKLTSLDTPETTTSLFINNKPESDCNRKQRFHRTTHNKYTNKENSDINYLKVVNKPTMKYY